MAGKAKRVLGKSPIGKTVHEGVPLGDSVGAQELAEYVRRHQTDALFRVGLKLAKARAVRNYSPELGRIRYKSFLRNMAKKYAIDIRHMPGKKGNKLFPACDLESLAKDYEHEFRSNWVLGMWESLLPKKLQRPAAKKASHEAMQHVGTYGTASPNAEPQHRAVRVGDPGKHPPKKRGRPKKAATKHGNSTAKRGRPKKDREHIPHPDRRAGSKKRGRPKGSKNKPK